MKAKGKDKNQNQIDKMELILKIVIKSDPIDKRRASGGYVYVN